VANAGSVTVLRGPPLRSAVLVSHVGSDLWHDAARAALFREPGHETVAPFRSRSFSGGDAYLREPAVNGREFFTEAFKDDRSQKPVHAFRHGELFRLQMIDESVPKFGCHVLSLLEQDPAAT
jgi:hypothetical protein